MTPDFPTGAARHGSPATWWEAISVRFVLVGSAALLLPTLLAIAQTSWTQEQGAHGPIVLATGLWLLARNRVEIMHRAKRGSGAIAALILVPALLAYACAKIVGIVEIEGAAMYAALLGVSYLLLGADVMRLLWFPILYLGFVVPPPESLVAAVTQPLKLWISSAAVELLYILGYPIGSSGVTIHVAQFQLLVAAACAGLNSMISLSAIGLFYVYILHSANWRYAAILTLAIVPVAIAANFIRVILLILITFHFGDAAAQGFIHNFAGVAMFMIALLLIFAIDAAARPLRIHLEKISDR